MAVIEHNDSLMHLASIIGYESDWRCPLELSSPRQATPHFHGFPGESRSVAGSSPAALPMAGIELPHTGAPGRPMWVMRPSEQTGAGCSNATIRPGVDEIVPPVGTDDWGSVTTAMRGNSATWGVATWLEGKALHASHPPEVLRRVPLATTRTTQCRLSVNAPRTTWIGDACIGSCKHHDTSMPS